MLLRINKMAQYSFIIPVVVLFLASSSGAPADKDKNLGLNVPTECGTEDLCNIKPKFYTKELEEEMNKVLPDALLEDYAQREGEDIGFVTESPTSDWHNCPYKKTNELYYYKDDINGTRRDIIVQTDLFKQYVQKIECMKSTEDDAVYNPDEQCFGDLDIATSNLKSKCIPTYTDHLLYVFDPEKPTNPLALKTFRVPACCSCHVYHE